MIILDYYRKFIKAISIRNISWMLNIARPFKWNIAILVVLGVLSSIVSVGSAVITKLLVDRSVYGNISQVVTFMLIFTAACLIDLAIGTLISIISVNVGQKMNHRVQQQLISKLYKTQWEKLSQYHSGDILTRLTNDIPNVSGIWISTVPSTISFIIRLALAFVVLLYLNKTLAFLALIVGPVLLLVGLMMGQKFKKLEHDTQTASSRHMAYMTELVQNMTIIKAFQYEKESLKCVKDKQNDLYQCVIRRNKAGVLANIIMFGGYWFSYIITFTYGVILLADRVVSFGTFTAFLQLVGNIQQPFMGLARSVPQMVSSMALVERVIELENLPNEEEYGYCEISVKTEKVGVAVKNITFAYKQGKKVLDNTSIYVEPGRIVALIGSSGEGKTTLMRLLLAFLQANEGSAYLDVEGKEKIGISPGSRSYFSYVPQGNTLFSGTIAYNLRMGKPDATDNELEEAVMVACAKEFIDELPEGMNTVIGEEGIGLSEGQAQRLCIARAVLRPAPVLLLDEATSALDMETERTIFENLRNLKKTCIVITHRLSVLPLCDAVFRLENGKIYEHGAYDFAGILEKGKQG